MSWINRINNITLKVITGEGSEFTPLYKNPSRSIGMNATGFDFINIHGTLVKRGETSGFRLPFEFHFTGIDNLDEAKRFIEAAKDKRPWKLIHPLYDELLVQPISINQNNSFENDSVLTGELWETIEDTYPDASIDVKEAVLESVDLANETLALEFSLKLGVPKASTLSKFNQTINNIANKFKLSAVTDFDFSAVQNAANEALATLDNVTQEPLLFMQKVTTLARTPAKFYASAQDRINVIEEGFADLKLSIGISDNNQEKIYFESLGGSLQSAKAESSVILASDVADEQQIEDNQIEDYQTRNDVLTTVESINLSLKNYLDTLGTFQSVVDATPDSYTPTQTTISTIKDAANKATGQLLQIAVEAKQERKYTVPSNIGIIMLVHRLLGTTDSDEIQSFAKNNDIQLQEWLQIEKGREIIYFI